MSNVGVMFGILRARQHMNVPDGQSCIVYFTLALRAQERLPLSCQ